MKRTVLSICILFVVTLTACSTRGETNAAPQSLAFDIADAIASAEVTDLDFSKKFKALAEYTEIIPDPRSHSPRVVKAAFEIDKAKMYHQMKRALYLSAYKDSPCVMTVRIGKISLKNTSLDISLAGLNLAKNANRTFTITLIDNGKRFPLGNGTPFLLKEKAWRDATVELPAQTCSDAHIEFSFTSSSPCPEHIFVGTPRIFKKQDARHTQPNVIFVVVDAMRADTVESIIHKYSLTPNIDSVARDGIAVKNCFTVTDWTRPSTVAMLSSVYASDSGINLFYPPVSDDEKNFFYNQSGIFPITTIAKTHGYMTRSIGNNAFILDYTGIGVDMDFDDASEYETQVEDTVDITEETVSWLEKNCGRKFFLFINYNAPHNAYIPPDRYVAQLHKKFPGTHPWFRQYMGEVAYTDDYFGKVISALKKLDLYDNTIIVILSDHGEVFDKIHADSPYTDVPSIYTHGQTQFDEELHVPLIIKPAASRGLSGSEITAQVRTTDIVPTLCEMLGFAQKDYFRGRSLVALAEKKESADRVLYSEGRMMYSVRAHGLKYAERFYGFGLRAADWGGDSVKEFTELYDLSRDPFEHTNIAGQDKKRVAEMRALLVSERFKEPDNVLAAQKETIRGRVRIENGFFYSVFLRGTASSLRKISRKEYEFTLAPGESLVYQTVPPRAEARISCSSAPLLCGRYLLPVAGHRAAQYTVKPALKQFQGAPSSDMTGEVNAALLYWHVPSRGLVEVRNEKYLSRNVNALLQKWGYIQGKEKKESSAK